MLQSNLIKSIPTEAIVSSNTVSTFIKVPVKINEGERSVGERRANLMLSC